MSKFCPNCGVENKEDYRFCKKCGTPLDTPKKSTNTKNILIIAITLILCVTTVAGTEIYLNGDFNLFSTKEPIHIINTTFTTGNSLSAKSTCIINLGTNHSGENITISVVYSRNGANLNNEDKSLKTIGEDGSIVVESKNSFKKYPDQAIVKIYDNEGKLLDSANVTLATDDSTQLAIGNGTITATSITTAQHSAAKNTQNIQQIHEYTTVEDASDISGVNGTKVYTTYPF